MSRNLLHVVLAGFVAVGLSGCFDLTQKVAVKRDGSGEYTAILAASGLMGDALKNGKSDMLKPNKAKTVTRIENGKVIQTSNVTFAKLSDIKLDDEQISLKVLSRDFFGFGPSHVRFRHVFHVDKARDAHGDETDSMGRDVMASIFGDHVYAFSVTLPGSIEHIRPVKIAGLEIKPQVTGDFYNGHTVVWRMPLSTALAADSITFEVDFSAIGDFNDVRTRDTRQAAL